MGDKELDALFKEIEEEIGKSSSGARKSFLLIFRARNPEELKKFHSKCDGKGPTLTILYGRYNVMFGGYTSKDWIGCTRKQIEDPNAFLFYKRESGDTKCKVYPILDGSKHKAITCEADLGPTFGGGDYILQQYDLLSFSLKSKGLEMIDDFMRLNGHVNFNGYCYKREGGTINPTDMNGGTMDVKMIEVYQVVDYALKTQWRKKPEDEEYKRMKNYLLNFKPQRGLHIPTYNILLVGVIGSGKSSFYNTLATVFSGEVKEPAPTANDASKSITNEKLKTPSDEETQSDEEGDSTKQPTYSSSSKHTGSLSEIESDSDSDYEPVQKEMKSGKTGKRTPWSEDEKKVVETVLEKFFALKKLPGKHHCE